MNPALFANPQLFGAYQQDPRNAYAQALMQQGMSTAPVRSPLEGLARALAGGLGGLQQGNIRKDYEKQGEQYRQGLAAALKGGDVIGALSSSGDPYLNQLGLDAQLKGAMAKQQAQIEGDQRIQTETALNPVMAQRAGQTAGATMPYEIQKAQAIAGIDVGKAVEIARQTLPIDTQKALGIAAGQAQIDLAKAAQMAPIQTAQAVAQAQALLPIEVQKAIGIAEGTLPTDIAKTQAGKTTWNTVTGPDGKPVYQESNLGEKKAMPGQEGGGAFKQENTLRDEYNTLTKDFRTVQDAYNKLVGTSDTGAGDMSLLYSYVKLLDPGSVVRESEFATAAASGSYGERIQGLVQRVMTGERLPPSLRAEFKAEAKSIYEGQKTGYDNAGKQYSELARKAGIDPSAVVIPYDTPDIVQKYNLIPKGPR
jgi:hypothetical protein